MTTLEWTIKEPGTIAAVGTKIEIRYIAGQFQIFVAGHSSHTTSPTLDYAKSQAELIAKDMREMGLAP